MPRNVRNFWMTASADGAQQVAAGPRSKDGGMAATFKVRNNGMVVDAIHIACIADADGSLTLSVIDLQAGKSVFTLNTSR
jgi:hypothetical protein